MEVFNNNKKQNFERKKKNAKNTTVKKKQKGQMQNMQKKRDKNATPQVGNRCRMGEKNTSKRQRQKMQTCARASFEPYSPPEPSSSISQRSCNCTILKCSSIR